MPPSGPRAGDTRSSTGTATASMPGKPQECRPRMPSRSRGRDCEVDADVSLGGDRLQCPRPGAEAGIERHRSLAGVADRAPDLCEIARGEIVALLQVDTLFGGFAGGIGRDRSELVGEPADKLGKLALAAAHLGQLADPPGALAVGLFEQPAADEREP